MKLVCPACGAVASAEAWAADAHMRQTMAILAALPAPVAERSLYYIALFRPRGGRGLSWARAEKLAGELRDLVSAGHVQWEHEAARPCPPRIWAEAIDTVRGRSGLRLPLENHNYLRRIAYDLADQADRRDETARNAMERQGRPRGAAPTYGQPPVAAPTGDEILTPEQVREQVAAIKSRIGRRIS